MQVMLMCCIDEGRWEAMPAASRDAVMREYGAWVGEMQRLGKHVATGKLAPAARAQTIRLKDGRRNVVDGPFAETKELVAGYWIWQVRSIEEAVEWVKRCPDPMPGEESEIEIRPIWELEEFDKLLTPELRAKEEQMRAEMHRRARS